jgi:hypothetical protein
MMAANSLFDLAFADEIEHLGALEQREGQAAVTLEALSSAHSCLSSGLRCLQDAQSVAQTVIDASEALSAPIATLSARIDAIDTHLVTLHSIPRFEARLQRAVTDVEAAAASSSRRLVALNASPLDLPAATSLITVRSCDLLVSKDFATALSDAARAYVFLCGPAGALFRDSAPLRVRAQVALCRAAALLADVAIDALHCLLPDSAPASEVEPRLSALGHILQPPMALLSRCSTVLAVAADAPRSQDGTGANMRGPLFVTFAAAYQRVGSQVRSTTSRAVESSALLPDEVAASLRGLAVRVQADLVADHDLAAVSIPHSRSLFSRWLGLRGP